MFFQLREDQQKERLPLDAVVPFLQEFHFGKAPVQTHGLDHLVLSPDLVVFPVTLYIVLTMPKGFLVLAKDSLLRCARLIRIHLNLALSQYLLMFWYFLLEMVPLDCGLHSP